MSQGIHEPMLAIIHALSDAAFAIVPDTLIEVLNFKTR
jgi:hypothetical protein